MTKHYLITLSYYKCEYKSNHYIYDITTDIETYLMNHTRYRLINVLEVSQEFANRYEGEI
jgi:hypothetical protein